MTTDPFILNPILAKLRTEFVKGQLLESDINKDPMSQFQQWLAEAMATDAYANAMVLSTVDCNGMPSSRVMLLRDISFNGFTFFTNYKSQKGEELEKNRHGALVFFWPALERQVRVTGTIKKLPAKESTAYFNSRPFGSKVAAWASQQSRVLSDRYVLEERVNVLQNEFKDKDVPRPDHWGGYVLEPQSIEFWQGRESRLHDRLRFIREDGDWKMERLMP